MEKVEFRRQVKDALEHLYDAAYLETHPLLSQFPNPSAGTRLTHAQKLRSLIKDTIEVLKPQDGSPAGSPEWRSYLALRHRYVQGMSQGEVESELGISLRQLQRELHKGLDAVAALLWEKRVTEPSPAGDETQELESELNRWEISRTRCDLQTLVDDTVWMLKPMLNERGMGLKMDLPASLAPVLVDATLTRQALFQVLRLFVQNAQQSSISVLVRHDEKRIDLILQNDKNISLETETDWRAAQLICEPQGIHLEARQLADGGMQVLFGLPRAAQPRVLVIDDNAAIHQLFERYLAPHHYEIIHAHGGQAALQMAAEKQPDAITLDVMMPNVDGWQVLRGLAGNPGTAQIPVIICSVLKEPELAFSLGARAYLKKPVDRLELIATLARLLSSAIPAAAASPLTPEDK